MHCLSIPLSTEVVVFLYPFSSGRMEKIKYLLPYVGQKVCNKMTVKENLMSKAAGTRRKRIWKER